MKYRRGSTPGDNEHHERLRVFLNRRLHTLPTAAVRGRRARLDRLILTLRLVVLVSRGRVSFLLVLMAIAKLKCSEDIDWRMSNHRAIVVAFAKK
jgi:hypothetical protein